MKFELPSSKSGDWPLLIAAGIFFIGIVGWLHYRNTTAEATAETHFTLSTLQQALAEYESVVGTAPVIAPGKPSMHCFLTEYQRAFAYKTFDGRWHNNLYVLRALRTDATVFGSIRMPDGQQMRGLVAVKDGFHKPIHYIVNRNISWRAPCFVSIGSGWGSARHPRIYSPAPQ